MVRQRIIRLALDEPALSPRELAVRFTDTESYFVSERAVLGVNFAPGVRWSDPSYID
jgi:hypothetical protein